MQWQRSLAEFHAAAKTLVKSFTPLDDKLHEYEGMPQTAHLKPKEDVIGAGQLPDSVAPSAPRHDRRPPIGKFIAAASFAFALICAGVLIVVELNKGTLTIESDVDDIPIRIMQGDNVVVRLTITTAGESVRVAAGNYSIELDDSFDRLIVDGDRVTLKRGQKEIVRILHSLGAT